MLLEEFEKSQRQKLSTEKKSKHLNFKAGDSVKVHYKITEGKTTRIQIFEGVVIARSKSLDNLNATFTVRKISNGVGVERTFQIHSPLLDDVIVTKKGDVRRGKLYFLRNLRGKASRIKEKLVFGEKAEKLAKEEEKASSKEEVKAEVKEETKTEATETPKSE
jgi:large subunit ribosomal protein L19